MVREFIAGWNVMQVLGEGTFAEVKLLVNAATGEACAMKEINLAPAEDPEAAAAVAEAVKKEICVHKLLDHENVVRCYGSRMERTRQFIFLEYCSGGELFDRIEPEVGMPEHQAQNFFKQLMEGIEYLHSRGVAHRDVKPENLLLSDGDVLKISDFGMATVFRHKGRERLLERRCGTMPYIAPEVLVRSQYNAEPADLWSCGMVLLAMLTGELPWCQPVQEEPNFADWRENNTNHGLWLRLDALPLSLLRRLLAPPPSKRCSLANAKAHLWYKKKFRDGDGNLLEPQLVSPPLKKNYQAAAADGDFICSTQPLEAFGDRRKKNKDFPRPAAPAPKQAQNNLDFKEGEGVEAAAADASGDSASQDRRDRMRILEYGAFSQPAKMTNCYTGTQQSTQTQSTQSSIYQRLVKRMTRFWVETGFDKTDDHIVGVLRRLGFKVSTHLKGVYTIETEDRRGGRLVFKCTFIRVEHRVLVDFRLSRGCGLEFKRHFAKVRANCRDILDKAPILWPALVPADAFPEVTEEDKRQQ